jgi:hypothetical protein
MPELIIMELGMYIIPLYKPISNTGITAFQISEENLNIA